MGLLKSIAFAAVACMISAAAPRAQTFPDHPIRIIVPQPPGGGFDAVARIIADPLSAILGQPVVVENKPGSGTLVGTDYAARAAPDGYTLLLGGTSNMALNQGLYPKISYDQVKSFAPVGLIVQWPFMLLVRKDSPYKTLKDLLDAARAKPDTLTYGSGGVGTGQHIAMAVLTYLAGVKMVHVPYAGAQAAYTDLLGGRIDVFADNAQTAMPQVKGGTVTPLAVTTAGRYAGLPDLPSAKETGLSAIDMATWFGLFAPSGTPAPILAKLVDAVHKARTSPQTIDLFNKSGGTLMTMTTDEEKAFAQNESDRWIKLLHEANIQAQ